MARLILLVDDDPDFRAVLALALELRGYSVRQADGGRKALELLGRERPDMIISDLEMTGMDGHALCRRAREETSLARIPFVILSTGVNPDASRDLADLPADCYLSKQLSVLQLVQSINELLECSPRSPRSDRPKGL